MRITSPSPLGVGNGDTRCSMTIDDELEPLNTINYSGGLVNSSAERWRKVMALRKRDREEERLRNINESNGPSGREDESVQMGRGRKDRENANAEDGEDNQSPGAEVDADNCKFLVLYSNEITKQTLF